MQTGALFAFGFLLFGLTWAQAPSRKPIGTDVACFASSSVARDATGTPVVLTTRELDSMAIQRRMPTFPQMAPRIWGSLRLKVLIDQSGRIRCAALENGHPLLVQRVTATFPSWRFRPYVYQGKPTAVLGYLDYRFQADDPRLIFLDFNYTPTAGSADPRR